MNADSRPGLAPRGIDETFGAKQAAHMTDEEIERGLALRDEKKALAREGRALEWAAED